MNTPGVELRPIRTLDGDREVNEVFFTVEGARREPGGARRTPAGPEISDNPMERTTVSVTTDGKNFLNGLINAQSTVSKKTTYNRCSHNCTIS